MTAARSSTAENGHVSHQQKHGEHREVDTELRASGYSTPLCPPCFRATRRFSGAPFGRRKRVHRPLRPARTSALGSVCSASRWTCCSASSWPSADVDGPIVDRSAWHDPGGVDQRPRPRLARDAGCE